jgi:hypothetical protein
LDASDMSKPVLRGGSLPLPSDVRELTLTGSHVFAHYYVERSSGPIGVGVIDISNPDDLKLMSCYSLDRRSRVITSQADRLYLLTRGPPGALSSELVILDTSNPTELRPISVTPIPIPGLMGLFRRPDRMILVGSHLYTTGVDGLHVIDISDATRPRHVAFRPIGRNPGGLDAHAGYVYVAEQSLSTDRSTVNTPGGLYIFDISQPANPSQVRIDTSIRDAIEVQVVGDRIYLLTGGDVAVFDATAPSSPVLKSKWTQPYGVQRLSVSPNRAFLASRQGIRVSELQSGGFKDTRVFPVPGMGIPTPGIAADGNLAYVVDDGTDELSGSRLLILDLSDPRRPMPLGSNQHPGRSERIAVRGQTAFVTAITRLQLIDVADPGRPQALGTVDDQIASLVVGDGYAYGSTSQILAIDFRDPQAPRALRRQQVGDARVPTGNLSLLEPSLFISRTNDPQAQSSDSTLYVADVSEPTNPRLRSSLPVPIRGGLFAGNERILVAADRDNVNRDSFELAVISVADPTAPRLLTTHPTPAASGLALAGDRAFLSGGSALLIVLNLADPSEPSDLAAFVGNYGARSGTQIAVTGDLVYVAGHQGIWKLRPNR